jgi:hypothetical protein
MSEQDKTNLSIEMAAVKELLIELINKKDPEKQKDSGLATVFKWAQLILIPLFISYQTTNVQTANLENAIKANTKAISTAELSIMKDVNANSQRVEALNKSVQTKIDGIILELQDKLYKTEFESKMTYHIRNNNHNFYVIDKTTAADDLIIEEVH